MDKAVDSELLDWLKGMHAAEASDLHVVSGHRPMYRVHGLLLPAAKAPLVPGRPLELLKTIAPPVMQSRLETADDLDFAICIGGGRRFRVNIFSSSGDRGACFRAIPETIPLLNDLGLVPGFGDRMMELNAGLVLVTGVTGSGKTTTLASIVQLLNAQGGHRIITIEEPIEYVYPTCEGSIVTQREVGADVPSFHEGLRSGLRQDPDVLLVGEIRDRETAQLALSAAETGHLIFATMHTMDAKGAITRLVDLFPSEMHDDVRTQLSMSLRWVIAQHLLPASDGGRRVLATEMMVASFAVRSAIRQGKIESLDSAIQSGRKDGMWTLDADLRRLLQDGRITLDTARNYAKDAAEFGG